MKIGKTTAETEIEIPLFKDKLDQLSELEILETYCMMLHLGMHFTNKCELEWADKSRMSIETLFDTKDNEEVLKLALKYFKTVSPFLLAKRGAKLVFREFR